MAGGPPGGRPAGPGTPSDRAGREGTGRSCRADLHGSELAREIWSCDLGNRGACPLLECDGQASGSAKKRRRRQEALGASPEPAPAQSPGAGGRRSEMKDKSNRWGRAAAGRSMILRAKLILSEWQPRCVFAATSGGSQAPATARWLLTSALNPLSGFLLRARFLCKPEKTMPRRSSTPPDRPRAPPRPIFCPI